MHSIHPSQFDLNRLILQPHKHGRPMLHYDTSAFLPGDSSVLNCARCAFHPLFQAVQYLPLLRYIRRVVLLSDFTTYLYVSGDDTVHLGVELTGAIRTRSMNLRRTRPRPKLHVSQCFKLDCPNVSSFLPFLNNPPARRPKYL